MFTTLTTLFSSSKLVLIGIALLTALGALILWKVYAKGRASAQADIAIAGLNKAILANQAKQEALRNPNPDRAHDPNNRANRH